MTYKRTLEQLELVYSPHKGKDTISYKISRVRTTLEPRIRTGQSQGPRRVLREVPPRMFTNTFPDIETQGASKNIFEMDPFSAEGELINLHNHFIQGQWQAVIDYDTSTLSPENSLPARVLSLRAQVALGHAEEVIADVQGEKEPEL